MVRTWVWAMRDLGSSLSEERFYVDIRMAGLYCHTQSASLGVCQVGFNPSCVASLTTMLYS